LGPPGPLLSSAPGRLPFSPQLRGVRLLGPDLHSPPRWSSHRSLGRQVRAWVALWCACAACATVPPPEGVAARYAEALRDGQLDAAYQLLDEGTRPDLATFRARYASEPERRRRSEAILQSLGSLRASTGEVDLVRSAGAGAAWRVADPSPRDAIRQALERFLAAVEGGDFEAAYRLLAPSWRARYTPWRLEQDFRLEPLARDRLARVRAALSGRVDIFPDGAQLPLGGGRAVRLVREGGGYTIAALE